MADVQTVNTEHYDLECPHCGKRDVWSIGSLSIAAKVRLEICEGRNGQLDWDYEEYDAERDHLAEVNNDYQHSECWCEWCGKTFVEPDIVPVTEEEKAWLLQSQLEKEGQQRLPITTGEDDAGNEQSGS